MRKRPGLFLIAALTTAFLLSISAAPVFAEEAAPPPADDPVVLTADSGVSSTDPTAPDETPVPCDPESGYVTGSEGTSGSGEPVDLGEGTVVVPEDVTPMEKSVDGAGTTDGTDESGAPVDGSTDDGLMYAMGESKALGAGNAAALPWLLLAGVGVAGLAIGFGAGWLVRRPAKAPAAQD